MCVVDWNLVLEFLKVVLAWPPIALVMLVAVSIVFRRPIEKLMGRVTEAKFPGGSFNAAPPQQESVPNAGEESTALDSSLAKKSSKVDANEDKARLLASLPPSLQEHPEGLDVMAQWVSTHPMQTLVEHVRTYQQLNFERTFNRIFGTQIELLVALSLRESLSRWRIAKYHSDFQSKSGNKDYGLDAYLQFLSDSNLIRDISNGKRMRYELTKIGRDFLDYVAAQYSNWSDRAL